MLLFRSLVFLGFFYLWTVLCVLTAWPMMIWSRRAGRWYVNVWARGVLLLLRAIAGVRYRVLGMENIPDTPCLIASKHQSAWEIFALLALLPDAAFVMKQELINIPLFGRYSLRVGMIPVERDKGASALRAITEMAEREIAAGRHIVIFPEGTRRSIGAPPDYKTGVGLFYKRFGVPSVPVALNSARHWPNGVTIKTPGTITVSFLPPIPAGLSTKAYLADLQDVIEKETEKLVFEAE